MAEKHSLDSDEPASPNRDRRSFQKRLRSSLPSPSTPCFPQMSSRQHPLRPSINQKMALAALARARPPRFPDTPPDPPLSSKRSRLAPLPDSPAPLTGSSSRSPPDLPPLARPQPAHRTTLTTLTRRRSPSASSADDYLPPPIASWNPLENRKALEPSQPQSSNPDELQKAKGELELSKKEAASLKDMIEAQTILLDSVRSSLSCNICLEILDSPYALLCGHIFCHKDLYAWFHRKSSGFDSTDSDSSDDDQSSEEAQDRQGQGSDFLSDVETRGGSNRDLRSHHHAHSDQDETDSERASVNRELAEAVQAVPFGRRAGVGSNGRAVPSRMTHERRKRNLICPQCRAPVGARPLPLYAIKEAADRLRAADAPAPVSAGAGAGAEGPLRAGVEEHRDERDLSWGGLFTNSNNSGGQRPRVVLDADDGVRRCGVCAWELDGHGVCEGCGEIYSDIGSESDGHSSSAAREDSIDLGTMYGTDSEEEPVGFVPHMLPAFLDSEASELSSEGEPARVIGRRRLMVPRSESESELDSGSEDGRAGGSSNSNEDSWRGSVHSSGRAESAGLSDMLEVPDEQSSELGSGDEDDDEADEMPGRSEFGGCSDGSSVE